MELRLNQACCLDRELLRAGRGSGWSRYQIILPRRSRRRSASGRPPGSPAWARRSTPCSSAARCGITSNGMTLESVQGRWRVIGGVDFDLLGVSSRLSTLDTLGSYRFSVRGGAGAGEPPR